MRSKTTTSMSKEHESAVADLFSWENGRRSRSSGANPADNVDVQTDSLVIECEATEAKSYRLRLDFWEEVVSKQHTGKLPALAIRFRDPTGGKPVDLIVMDANDISGERETLE